MAASRSRHATFDALNQIDNALVDLRGTVRILSTVIDQEVAAETETSLHAVERHLEADLAVLCAAFQRAYDALLKPRPSKAYSVKGGAS